MAFDLAARARIARGWLNSSLDQQAYAAQHGISTRTLREWVCRYGAGRRPQAQLRAVIVASIEQLQNVLAALDAEAAADSASAREDGPEGAPHQFERHAGSEGQAMAPGGTPASSERVAPQAMVPDAEWPATARYGSASLAGLHDQGRREKAPPAAVDLEALRKRAAQLRAVRAAGGAPRRNPFLD